MNKFELGLQYDDENLIIPQLLPTEKQLREKQPNVKEVWVRSTFSCPECHCNVKLQQSDVSVIAYASQSIITSLQPM
jgi:hypothetical protein